MRNRRTLCLLARRTLPPQPTQTLAAPLSLLPLTSCTLISALRSFSALPALRTKGTPAQLQGARAGAQLSRKKERPRPAAAQQGAVGGGAGGAMPSEQV